MINYYFRPINGLYMNVDKLFDPDYCYIWEERADERRERLRVELGKNKAYDLLYFGGK